MRTRRREKKVSVQETVLKISPETPCSESSARTGSDAVTDLLWVTLCERQFSCDMEHDVPPLKGSEDCFTSCLTMTHIQSSSEPEEKGARRPHHLILHTTRVICATKQHQRGATLPSKALQLNRLSKNGKELFKFFTFLIVAKYVLLSELERDECCQRGSGVMTWYHISVILAAIISHLSLLLAQNAKLEIRRHSVFIKCSYEFWSLRDEREGDLKRFV